MARTVGIGNQSFDVIRREEYFYIDKTPFIKEWWESGDNVTLIARPRRFGKTLTMDMIESFFSKNTREETTCFGVCGYGIMKSSENFREHIR